MYNTKNAHSMGPSTKQEISVFGSGIDWKGRKAGGQGMTRD